MSGQFVHAKSTETIVIALNDWPSQRVLSRVYGQLLLNQGYRVDYLEISPRDQWGAFKRGLIHFQVELWQTNHQDFLRETIKLEQVVDLGSHDAIAREEWWYPSYVEKFCPGLPDWRSINECASLFSNWKSKGKAVYYNGPWGFEDAIRVRALNLNVDIERLNSESALWEKLAEAEAEQKPVMLINWTPNWTDARVAGSFIEFPDYDPQCVSNPSWGLNETITHDCGYTKSAWVKKVAWFKASEVWPCANEIMRNFTLDKVMIGEAAALIVKDKYSEDEAAAIWLDTYSSEQKKWIPKKCIR